jgi:hypothetical protein
MSKKIAVAAIEAPLNEREMDKINLMHFLG